MANKIDLWTQLLRKYCILKAADTIDPPVITVNTRPIAKCLVQIGYFYLTEHQKATLISGLEVRPVQNMDIDELTGSLLLAMGKLDSQSAAYTALNGLMDLATTGKSISLGALSDVISIVSAEVEIITSWRSKFLLGKLVDSRSISEAESTSLLEQVGKLSSIRADVFFGLLNLNQGGPAAPVAPVQVVIDNQDAKQPCLGAPSTSKKEDEPK